MKKVGIIFPGTGEKFKSPRFDLSQHEAASPVFTLADEVSGIHVLDHDDYNFQDHPQLSVLVYSMAIASILGQNEEALLKKGYQITGTAGHGLGAVTAFWQTGMITMKQVIELISNDWERLLKEAGKEHSGAMAIVRGLRYEDVVRGCRKCSTNSARVEIAFINGYSNVVISGDATGVVNAWNYFIKNGGIMKMLDTEIALHSTLVGKASKAFDTCFLKLELKEPGKDFFLNSQVFQSRETIYESLLGYMVNIVDWVGTIDNMLDSGYRHFIIAGPGEFLGGSIDQLAKEKGLVVKIALLTDLKSINAFIDAPFTTLP